MNRISTPEPPRAALRVTTAIHVRDQVRVTAEEISTDDGDFYALTLTGDPPSHDAMLIGSLADLHTVAEAATAELARLDRETAATVP